MEIEIGLTDEGQGKILAGVILAIMTLIGLALLGRAVTPAGAGEPAVLTPERWQAASLARRARAETAQLQRDAMALRALLERPDPDPVQAMLLAQRVYAHHRIGTSATAAARQALIEAAAVLARYASGSESWQGAANALNDALALIRKLSPPDASGAPGDLGAGADGWQTFLPLVVRRGPVRSDARPAP